MLISTRRRKIQRKVDWFSQKKRVHFDRPLAKVDALRLVSDPMTVARHAFLPLICFVKKERRYRRRSGEKRPTTSSKTRELAYPSNRDGYIYAYYAERLNTPYEVELAARGLTGTVIGYRKGSSNIDRAFEAFTEIRSRGECVAVALDITGFFDNIDHCVLKNCWSSLLGCSVMPLDHYRVFCALTKAGKIDRSALLIRLGYDPKSRDRDLPRPLCSVQHFRSMRRSAAPASKLVTSHKATRGIPQGTPLSAAAANISMLEFDTAMKSAADTFGGSYRRYSDDILLICSADKIQSLEFATEEALKVHTQTLHLNVDKREEARFILPGPVLDPGISKPLQYLGFTFDGRRALIRGGTLARYYRRMVTGARVAKGAAKRAKAGKIKGRKILHKREVFARHSHLGPQSFVSSYARLSARKMGELGNPAIKRQMSKHVRIMSKHLK